MEHLNPPNIVKEMVYLSLFVQLNYSCPNTGFSSDSEAEQTTKQTWPKKNCKKTGAKKSHGSY